MSLSTAKFVVLASCGAYIHILNTCNSKQEADKTCKEFLASKHRQRILRKTWRGGQWKVYIFEHVETSSEILLGRRTEKSLKKHLQSINMEHRYEELVKSCPTREHINALARKRYWKDPTAAKIKEYQRRERRAQELQSTVEDTFFQKPEV